MPGGIVLVLVVSISVVVCFPVHPPDSPLSNEVTQEIFTQSVDPHEYSYEEERNANISWMDKWFYEIVIVAILLALAMFGIALIVYFACLRWCSHSSPRGRCKRLCPRWWCHMMRWALPECALGAFAEDVRDSDIHETAINDQIENCHELEVSQNRVEWHQIPFRESMRLGVWNVVRFPGPMMYMRYRMDRELIDDGYDSGRNSSAGWSTS